MPLASGSIADVFDTPDTVNGYTLNTMAQEIDKALNALRVGKGLSALPGGKDATDRRMLFIAIAKGVIAHLKQNQTSLSVHVDPTTHDGNVTVQGS